MNIHAMLKSQNLSLPKPPAVVASYAPALISNGHVYISGQLPMLDGKLIATGKVPVDVSMEEARHGARQCILNGLAAFDQAILCDWSRFRRIVRLGAFIASGPDFTDQHHVANGASELLVELFGDAGRHTRAAVGVASLPLNAAVEIELLIAIA